MRFPKTSLELLRYFLALGLTGFGGPTALIAQMQKDLIQSRKWLEETDFLAALGLIKSLPGPVAFQTATFIGYRRGGFWGAVASGVGLVLPSFLIVVFLGEFLPAWQTHPAVGGVLYALQRAALAIIAFAIWMLAKPFLEMADFWLSLGAAILCIYFELLPEPLLVVGAGLGTMAARWPPQAKLRSLALIDTGIFFELMRTSLFAGGFMFGSGLAIVPYLEKDFVDRLGWLTHQEFLQALALGQLTPGPTLITLSYIGYLKAGLIGATLATVVVFLPGFFHMTTWFPRLFLSIAGKEWLKNFSRGALGAVTGTILYALLRLLSTEIYTPGSTLAAPQIHWLSAYIVLFAGFMLWRKWSTPFVLLIVGTLGFFLG